MEVVIVYFS